MNTERTLIRRIVIAALMAALVTVLTLLRIPVPMPVITGAYIHPGDSMIYASAWMLGPLGAVSAGLGSLLADLLASAAQYAPGTLVIKTLMALITAGLMRMLGDRLWARLAAMLAGGVFMAVGYAAYEWAVFGPAVMLAGLPFNFLQAAGSAALALPLLPLLERVPQVRALRKRDGEEHPRE
ncbi:MAG: ECF transporter S component [Christensenellales bacterium]|jgi:uncharacterized membrane protein